MRARPRLTGVIPTNLGSLPPWTMRRLAVQSQPSFGANRDPRRARAMLRGVLTPALAPPRPVSLVPLMARGSRVRSVSPRPGPHAAEAPCGSGVRDACASAPPTSVPRRDREERPRSGGRDGLDAGLRWCAEEARARFDTARARQAAAVLAARPQWQAARYSGATRGRCDSPPPRRPAPIADALGLSTVHVNRVLQELRGKGLIAWNRGVLNVPDWDKLQREGEFDPTYLHISQGEAA